MINPQELRLGNIVLDSRDYFRKIECIDDEGVWMNEGFARVLAEGIKPVPLSPDLLEKCGFKQSSFTQYEFKEFRITALDSIDENGPYKLLFGFKGTIECIEVQHLHQLQNLVFVLTGSELPITL